MSEYSEVFGISIPVETNAPSAVEELSKLDDQIKEDKKSLRDMQAALRDMKDSVTVSADSFKQLRAAIEAKKISIAGATAQVVGHREEINKLRADQAKAAAEEKKQADDAKRSAEEKEKAEKAAEKAASDAEKKAAKAKAEADKKTAGKETLISFAFPKIGKLRAESAKIKGAIKDAFPKVDDASAAGVARLALGAKAVAGAVGLVAGAALAAAAAVGVLATAAAYATKKFVEYGLAIADARRNQKLLLQAAGASLMWGQASKNAGEQAQLAIDKVSRDVPIATDRVAGFAQELAAARLQGEDLRTALRAVSVAASVGKEAGLVGAFAGLARTGQGVDKLAARVENLFGGVVAEQMESTGVQAAKLGENFHHLFDLVDVKPFAGIIKEIASWFSKFEVTGYALRKAIGGIFTVFGKDAKGALPTTKELFQRIVLVVLQLTVKMLELRRAFKRFLDDHPLLKNFATDSKAMADAVVNGFKEAFAGMVGSIPLIGPLLRVAFFGTGVSIVDGMIDGLKGGVSRLVEAIKNLGKEGVEALKHVWDSHSPSRVTRDMYRDDIIGGAVIGTKEGQGDLDRAMSDAMGPGPGASSGGKSAKVSAGPQTVTINVTVPAGTENAQKFGQDVAKSILAELGDALETMAHNAGATLPGDEDAA